MKIFGSLMLRLGNPCFLSSGVIVGGKESAALTGVMPFAAHPGIIFVPIGYTNKSAAYIKEANGFSPHGVEQF